MAGYGGITQVERAERNMSTRNAPDIGATVSHQPTSSDLYAAWVSAQMAAFGAAGDGGAAARASAQRMLDIQKKKAQFELDTGLRDIGQDRELGIKGAINNALQRGIYRSGIRVENEQLVNREADEAASDLKTQIQFTLDSLAEQRTGLNSGSGGSSFKPPSEDEIASTIKGLNDLDSRSTNLNPPPPARTFTTPDVGQPRRLPTVSPNRTTQPTGTARRVGH